MEKERIDTTDAEYAARNLQDIKEGIGAYASYARNVCCKMDDGEGNLYDKVDAAKFAVNELIEYIVSMIGKTVD